MFLSMEQIGIEDARRQLGEIVDRARFTDQPTLITRQGKPAAVVVGAESYEAMLGLLADAATERVQRNLETHYQDETGWHRKHDVYGGPHDEPPTETPGDPR
jgi:prevent-host-death family protein